MLELSPALAASCPPHLLPTPTLLASCLHSQCTFGWFWTAVWAAPMSRSLGLSSGVPWMLGFLHLTPHDLLDWLCAGPTWDGVADSWLSSTPSPPKKEPLRSEVLNLWCVMEPLWGSNGAMGASPQKMLMNTHVGHIWGLGVHLGPLVKKSSPWEESWHHRTPCVYQSYCQELSNPLSHWTFPVPWE